MPAAGALLTAWPSTCARRGQLGCPQDEPVDSRLTPMPQLSTAPSTTDALRMDNEQTLPTLQLLGHDFDFREFPLVPQGAEHTPEIASRQVVSD